MTWLIIGILLLILFFWVFARIDARRSAPKRNLSASRTITDYVVRFRVLRNRITTLTPNS